MKNQSALGVYKDKYHKYYQKCVDLLIANKIITKQGNADIPRQLCHQYASVFSDNCDHFTDQEEWERCVVSQFTRMIRRHILWEPQSTHPLQSGTFGKVYLTDHKYTGPTLPSPFALKVIDLSKMDVSAKELQLQEALLLSNIKSPFIVGLHDFYSYKDNLYLVLEYCAGETLVEYADTYRDESDVKLIIYQILKGLEYLHARHILHLDLKIDNIMLCPDILHIKLIDFGYALEDSEFPIKNHLRRGTVSYNEPERYLVVDDDGNLNYDQGMDVWSVATILFQLLFLESPFVYLDKLGKQIAMASNELEQDDKIKNFYEGCVPFGLGKSWSRGRDSTSRHRFRRTFKSRLPYITPEAIDFLESIFVPLQERPNVSTLLQSPWMQGVEELYETLKS